MILVSLLLPFLLLLSSTDANSITSTKNCYIGGENFTFTFTDTSPSSTDMVGIRKADGTSLLSITSICGSNTTCALSPPTSGRIFIAEKVAVGLDYKAVLLRRTGRILATSAKFSVSNVCGTVAPSRQPTFKPTSKPTKSPTAKPSRRPTLPPTPLPTKTPVALPTKRPTAQPSSSAPTEFSINLVAEQTLQQARVAIAALVQADPRLTPEFLRMGFHDCVGGCDGCIDMTNPDNNGLAHPISVLDPIVQQFAKPGTGVTRTDIWALASMVGADVAPRGSESTRVNFNMNWFGRVNCEDANTVCRNNDGQVVACSSTVGPGRIMASPNFDSNGVFGYFSANFGFDERQTVAIMGAHSVGHMVQGESGINGPNGWTFDHVTLQNEYYNALIGAASASTPQSQMASLSPRWTRAFTNNAGTGLPDRNTWNLTIQGVPIVMLDSDIALVRNLNPTNQNSTTGAVSCAFNPVTAGSSPVCQVASSIQFAAEFSDSNDVWMNEFAAVMDLMLTNGYNRNVCSHNVCALTPNPISLPAPVQPPTLAPVSPTSAPVKPTAAPVKVTSAPTSTPSSAPVATKKPTTAPATITSDPTTTNPTSPPVATTKPTAAPTRITPAPTSTSPTSAPIAPTSQPTAAPVAPTSQPTAAPVAPTSAPIQPTTSPSASPTTVTTSSPSSGPTKTPVIPTIAPVQPTAAPTRLPTGSPTTAPVAPTQAPVQPTSSPTGSPSSVPPV